MKSQTKCLGALFVVVMEITAGCGRQPQSTFESIKDQAVSDKLKSFVAEKEAQAIAATNIAFPKFGLYFAAAKQGNWPTVNKLDVELRNLYQQSGRDDLRLHGTRWEAMIEVWSALQAFAEGDEKYSVLYSKEIIDSIPAGSIYFGSTDAGRGLVTAMQKSHAKADPFFALTQNALADSSYLDYVRGMYGRKIYIPDAQDAERCFRDYLADAQKRLKENKLYPGEDAKEVDGKIQVSGQVSVMLINGLLAKVIFDKNPDREFYIEESFPLDWMYPHLEPHGLIMKINRQPLAELSDELLRRDRDYWTKLTAPMIGNWLQETTSVKSVSEFVERIFIARSFGNFTGDTRFLSNKYSQRIFSKERSNIGGLYSWRLGISPNGRETPVEFLPKSKAERQRMIRAADFAYRQSWALCPDSPEAVYRYIAFLTSQSRYKEATIVVDMAVKFCSDEGTKSQFQDLSKRLHQYENQNPKQKP